MTDPEQFYRLAMARIYRNLLFISGAGTVTLLAWKGWAAGLGFLAGASASLLNFRWMHRLVDALGPQDGTATPKGQLAAILGFRYLIFGTVAYAIVKYFRINPIAILGGLLAVVAAVLFEILYELIYARA